MDNGHHRFTAESLNRIMKAAHFAALKHASQRRKGDAAEPYINHLLEVAELVSGVLAEPDPELVMAALLHDTIEDTGVTRDELTEHFGPVVTALVVECTDDKSLPKAERKRLQIENAPHKSVRAQKIKLADKTSNLRAILNSPPADWSLERRREYFIWAKRVVDGFTQPEPALRAAFDEAYTRFTAAYGLE